jgi:hypothetical protein
MDVSKLFKAASLLSKTDPEISKELKKIALDVQKIDGLQPEMHQAPQDVNPVVQPNAGESQYFSTSKPEESTQHQFTITLRVNKETPKNEIANEVYKVLQELEKQKGYEITDYGFKSKNTNG